MILTRMLQPVSFSGAAVPGAGNRGGQRVCTGIWDLATRHLFGNTSSDEHSQGKQYEPPGWERDDWQKRDQARKNGSEKDPLCV